jgi:ADP-ribose pyrophosphatase
MSNSVSDLEVEPKVERPVSKQPIPGHAKRVFEGKIFDIYQWEQKLFDGSTAIFEKAKRRSDSVSVLPITDEGKIVLCQQEQPGEIPFIGALGGRMDPGEAPLETAKREMLEESGMEAEKFGLLLAVQPDIKVDWACYTFIAKGLKKSHEMTPEAGEKIKIIEVTFDQYMKIITQDNYRDSDIAFFLLLAQKDTKRFEELRKKFE